MSNGTGSQRDGTGSQRDGTGRDGTKKKGGDANLTKGKTENLHVLLNYWLTGRKRDFAGRDGTKAGFRGTGRDGTNFFVPFDISGAHRKISRWVA